MMNTIGGYSWQNRPAADPAVTAAFRYSRQTPGTGRLIKHTDWVLDLTVSGNSRYRAGKKPGDWKPRPAGTAHLYAPGVSYWEDYPPEELPVVSTWITFTGGETAGLTRLTGENGYVIFNDPDGMLRKLLDRSADLARELGQTGFWQVQAVLMEVIALLLNSDDRVIGFRTYAAAGPDLSEQVKQYLRKRLADKVSLQGIADHCHISRSSLTHRYKAETGETPWTTLQLLRIDFVKIMLTRGERLQAIAEQTGFSDEYHLSRTFKRLTGSSPRDFLKNG